MDNVEIRLARLERSNRRWRLGCVGLLACLALRAALGAAEVQAVFDTVVAHQVLIVDGAGHSVGSIGSDKNGGLIGLRTADLQSYFAVNAVVGKDGATYGGLIVTDPRTQKIVASVNENSGGGDVYVGRPDGQVRWAAPTR